MRWVLLILNFQQHNLTEARALAPTMSRTSRNRLKAGDVTTAFLQAGQSLGEEDLTVWAPAELAVLFGADPEHPVLPLRVAKAFYGLVHAPRLWHVHGRRPFCRRTGSPLLSDKCIYYLQDHGAVVGLVGLHVDDFLVGGKPGNAGFEEAFKQMENSYRWGKWAEGDFIFAGIHVRQNSEDSILIAQSDYTDKWVEEIEISKARV